jgi:hypothetical protein
MFQTWPSHEAYMADVAWQNEQEALVRKYSLEKCVHGVSMTSGCEKCGAPVVPLDQALATEKKES